MGKTANAIYAGSCSTDLSAARLVLCFYYDVYISSYSERICFYLLFQIRCVLSFKAIYLILLLASCSSLMLLICAFYAFLLLHAY